MVSDDSKKILDAFTSIKNAANATGLHQSTVSSSLISFEKRVQFLKDNGANQKSKAPKIYKPTVKK